MGLRPLYAKLWNLYRTKVFIQQLIIIISTVERCLQSPDLFEFNKGSKQYLMEF